MDQVDVDALPRGAIIATARIADVRCIVHHWMEPVDPAVIGDRLPLPNDPELTFGDYTPGRFAWLLADMRPLATLIPCRGALGLWTVPDDVAAIVERDALERATR